MSVELKNTRLLLHVINIIRSCNCADVTNHNYIPAFVSVLRDVLRAEYRDAQAGTYLTVLLIFFSSLVFHGVRGCQIQAEPLTGCELNWASVMVWKQADPLHTNNNTTPNLCHSLYKCCEPLLEICIWCASGIWLSFLIRLKVDFGRLSLLT